MTHTGDKVRWVSAPASIGSLVRWKELKSHRWEYGIYQGTQDRTLTFSAEPKGPIVRWLRYTPRIIEVATVELRPVQTDGSGRG